MSSWRATALFATIGLILMPATLTAKWIDFGAGDPGAMPETTLESTDFATTSLRVRVAGAEAEEITNRHGTFIRLTIPGQHHMTAIGHPAVPVIRESIEIPQGAVPSLRVTHASYTEIPLAELGLTGNLVPVQPPVEKVPGAIQRAPFVIDAAAYARSGFSPAVPAALGEIGQIRAHRFVELEIYPVQYDAAAGIVRYLESIELTVDHPGGDRARTSELIQRLASPDFDALAARHLVNAQTFAGRDLLPLPIGYLVITYDAFHDQILPLAELRQRLGFEATVTRLSEIPGGPTTTGIKAYIQEAYDTWPVPPTFVVLVGDTPQLPCFQGTGSNSASDNPYVCMDGASDWLPDMYVGRFSCTTATEVAHLVDKTVSYTLHDLGVQPADWVKKATFMASTDNHTVSEGTHNYVIDTWVEPAGFTCNRRYSYDGATTQQCIDDINGGLSQLTYSGHGSVNGWADGPPLSATQVNALQNVDMWPIVQSYACVTGSFDSFCFGETWTRASNGTLLYLGASNNSYWTEDDIMERAVYDAWFGDDYVWVRGMFNEGLWAVYEAYSGGGSTHYYYDMYTVFGDPALMPWTEIPADIEATYASAFLIGASLFSIDVGTAGGGPLAGALVCLTMDGQCYETAYTDAAGHADIAIATPPTTPGTLLVSVSAQNHVPHLGEVQVIPPDGPYLVFEGCQVLDAGGDADGHLDACESPGLDVALENVGIEPTTGISATLTVDDPYVTVTTGTVAYPDIPAGASATGTTPFELEVAGDTPDGHAVVFTLVATASEGQWECPFSLPVEAPVLLAGELRTDDSAGNANGRPDPGDVITVQVTISNDGHSASPQLTGLISTVHPDVVIHTAGGTCPSIPIGGEGTMGTFELELLPGCPTPAQIPVQVVASGAAGFQATLDYEIPVGPWFDDVESDRGWALGAPGDDATSGLWVREDPVEALSSGGQVAQPEDDHTPAPGVICFVTGNAAPGAPSGTNDVDGGKTTLLTPVFDLADAVTATVSYCRWYSNDLGNNPGQDWWAVDASDDGASWVHLENTQASSNAWTAQTFDLADFVSFTDHFQMRFVAEDASPGSLVEALVDDFMLDVIRGSSSGLGPDEVEAVRAATGIVSVSPNPFNPRTHVVFALGRSSRVSLRVYDVHGRMVRELVEGVVEAGEHTVLFDGRSSADAALASGIYFLRMETPEILQVRQVTLLK